MLKTCTLVRLTRVTAEFGSARDAHPKFFLLRVKSHFSSSSACVETPVYLYLSFCTASSDTSSLSGLSTTHTIMNCPSRTDEDSDHPGWNQNPSALAADITTREDLNGIANSRVQRDGSIESRIEADAIRVTNYPQHEPSRPTKIDELGKSVRGGATVTEGDATPAGSVADKKTKDVSLDRKVGDRRYDGLYGTKGFVTSIGRVLAKFGKFVGPGFLISVAYIDPGNYSTDIAAGAAYKFRLLFIILLSNLFAIFLQSLCVKLGTVTGLNLAEHCRAHLPRWLNITLYILAESAIIATDIAEVRFPSLDESVFRYVHSY